MKAVLYAAFLAVMLGAAPAGRAQSQAADPAEVIYPRGAAPAAQTQAADAPNPFSPPATGVGFGQAAGYIAVLGMLVGGAWLLVRRGSLPRPFSKSEGRLKVLETKMLGNRQFLMVVEYEEAKMLLGVCQGRIDYLTPLAPGMAGLAGGAVDDEERSIPFIPRSPESHR